MSKVYTIGRERKLQDENKTENEAVEKEKLPDLDLSRLDADKRVSRKHATISFSPEHKQFAIASFGRNGTKLNNELLPLSTPFWLKHGDCVGISKVQLAFVFPEKIQRSLNKMKQK